MRAHRKAGFAICLLLGACASTESYDALLNSWIGLRSQDLVEKWGPPRQVISHSNGAQTFIWLRRGNVGVGANMPNMPVELPPQVELWCRTSFRVGGDGRIASGTWSGNNCVASPRNPSL